MRIVSWNVNGVRSCTQKGLGAWIDGCDADVIGLQEVRATAEQVPEEIRSRPGWRFEVSAAERLGYSGVGLLTRTAAERVTTSLGAPEFDIEGRVQIAEFGALVLANVYFPNGNGKERDNSRVPYKLEFYRRLFDVLQTFRAAGRPVLVMGDFNTAHTEIDLARPKENVKISGFLPEERAEVSRWIEAGWTDTFRLFEQGGGHYTWWSARFGVRARNVGWRIDMVLASEAAVPYVRHGFIWPQVQGSDHCPVGVDLDPAIRGHGG